MSDCEYILLCKIYTHCIKDIHKLEAIKLLPSEKKLLKQYRRLSTRYDKYSSNYMIFLYLACSDIILKNINK